MLVRICCEIKLGAFIFIEDKVVFVAVLRGHVERYKGVHFPLFFIFICNNRWFHQQMLHIHKSPLGTLRTGPKAGGVEGALF